MGRFPDPNQFNDLVVAPSTTRPSGSGYRLRRGRARAAHHARYDGKPAVSLRCSASPARTSIEVINGIKARLPGIRKLLPAA